LCGEKVCPSARDSLAAASITAAAFREQIEGVLRVLILVSLGVNIHTNHPIHES
jgi:hypothetical protein